MKATDLCLALSPAISAVVSTRRALPPPTSIPDPLLLWHLPGRHRDSHISAHAPAQPPVEQAHELVSIPSNPALHHRKPGGDPMLLNTL